MSEYQEEKIRSKQQCEQIMQAKSFRLLKDYIH